MWDTVCRRNRGEHQVGGHHLSGHHLGGHQPTRHLGNVVQKCFCDEKRWQKIANIILAI